MKLIALAAACCVQAVVLGACAKGPVRIADASEVSTHRLISPIIRGADQCVNHIARMQDVGYGFYAHITLRVDRMGRTYLSDIQASTPWQANLGVAQCRDQIEAAIGAWRYRPFERDGRAIEAVIIERVLMLPAERWRATPRQFPAASPSDSVVITLERWSGLYLCDGDRPASYLLQIRGDGEVTITERLRNAEGGRAPAFVNGAVRRLTIDRQAVERLVEQFRAANFFSLEDEYASGITDQPYQILTFEVGSARARVTDIAGETVGMPLVVRSLQEAVDSAAGLAPLRCGPHRTLQSD